MIGGAPIQETWSFIVSELSQLFTWTYNVRLFEIPMIMYFAGLGAMAIIIDYVFG